MSSTYKLEVSDNNGTKNLKFSGDLVIKHADKILEELKPLLNPVSDVNIEIDNPENIDMTFVQLVVAVKHSCAEAGKNCQVKTSLKDDLKELICKAGLNRDLNIQ